jgi:hypothetical protein
MKNSVLLENYYLPGDLEQQIGAAALEEWRQLAT